jgi:hypothetical protein
METATWTIAAFTGLYAFAVLISLVFIYRQVSENRRLSELTALKEAYKYVMDTHEQRTEILRSRKDIEAVNSQNSLMEFRKHHHELYNAVQEVANCYQFIGLLMKHHYMKDEKVFVNEASVTFQQIHSIMRGVITQERIEYGNPQYKCYLEYLDDVIRKHSILNDKSIVTTDITPKEQNSSQLGKRL